MTAPSFNLSFPSVDDSNNYASYRLIELPPDLLKAFESGDIPPGSLCIKGRTTDDAVLCTSNSTYSIRSISVSNTVAVITSPNSSTPLNHPISSTPVGNIPAIGEYDLVVRDQLHEFLELVPIMPKLGQLDALLRGVEYGNDEMMVEGDGLPTERRRVTYEQAKRLVQASPQELDDALQKARVITVDGALRPMSLQNLSEFLLQSLNILISEDFDLQRVAVGDLSKLLSREHDVPLDVTSQIIRWFGVSDGEYWEPDLNDIVKVVGLALLSESKHVPVDEKVFMSKWRSAVGDSFEDRVNISLLTGNYLSSASDPSASATSPSTLQFFPSSELPATPLERFRDMFATRPKWRADVLLPFLDDITINKKDRDKLLLKFCRTVTDENGQTWYTGRGNY